MDPLSDLTVACAVIEFVDFGSKLVGTSREVYKYGAPEDIVEVEALAAHAEQLSKKLSLSSQTWTSSTGASGLNFTARKS
jgi:hypothetical protein